MLNKFSKILFTIIIFGSATALTIAFTTPVSDPSSASSSADSLLFQMAGTDFNSSTDSLHAISCYLDPAQASC